MRGLVLAACLLAAGCGGTVSRPASDETQNPALQRIVRGTTTKDEVRALLGGSPRIEPVENGEQWTYESNSKLAGGNYIPGAGFTPQTEKHQITLIVFDKQGIVYDFTSYSEVR